MRVGGVPAPPRKADGRGQKVIFFSSKAIYPSVPNATLLHARVLMSDLIKPHWSQSKKQNKNTKYSEDLVGGKEAWKRGVWEETKGQWRDPWVRMDYIHR